MDELQDDPGAEARYRALPGADSDGWLKALYDGSWRVRRLAAELLGRPDAEAPAAMKLVAVLGDRENTGARNAAALALGRMGPAATPPLIALLAHADPDQRKLAADSLGERRDSLAVEPLERTTADTDANVQGAAAEALGRIGGARAARALSALLDSPRPLVQACALEALYALRRPPPLPRLKRLLAPSPTARAAFRVLGLIDHAAAYTLIGRAIEAPATRDAALAALGNDEHAWPVEAEASLKASLEASPDAHAWLTRALTHEDRAVRSGAMHAVAVLKAAVLAPAVAAAVGDGELAEHASRTLTRLGLKGALALLDGDYGPLLAMSPEARAVASEAITRIGEPVLVPQLKGLLVSGDPELAEVAARALGRCRTPAAIPPLVDALGDDVLASAAARALARIGASFPDEVVAAFASVPIRPHVLRALVQVDPRRARDAVRAAAKDSDDSLRAAGAEASTSLDSAEAAELLGRCLNDEAAVVRRSAAHALAGLSLEVATPLLTRALKDRDSAVTAAACDATADLRATSLRPRLVELVGAPEGFVVLAALNALSVQGGLEDATGIKALAHSDAEVVKAALGLLADRPSCLVHAKAHLQHPRWDVRAAAARALEVSGDTSALPPLHAAIAVEGDAMAREIFEAVAATLAER